MTISVPIQWQSLATNATRHTGQIDIDPALALFEGHFPDHPILPGVVQVLWALNAARERVFATGATRLRGMQNIKFKSPITPGDRVTLVLESSPGRVDFRYVGVDNRVRTQGRLLFDD